MSPVSGQFAGQILAAFPVHLTRWREDDPRARNPLIRAGDIAPFLAQQVEPVLERVDRYGRRLVDGVLFNRFSGVLEKPRPVGKRSDGKIVETWCASVADLPDYAQWLEPISALARRVPVYVHDGMPIGSAALIACAARRYQKLGVAGVSYDVSGQVQSLGVHAIFVQTEQRGVPALAEPAPLERFRPTWLHDRPCCTNGERWTAVEHEAQRKGVEPPSGIDWYNGKDDGPWEWNPLTAKVSLEHGRAVAIPDDLVTPALIEELRGPPTPTTEGNHAQEG